MYVNCCLSHRVRNFSTMLGSCNSILCLHDCYVNSEAMGDCWRVVKRNSNVLQRLVSVGPLGKYTLV